MVIDAECMAEGKSEDFVNKQVVFKLHIAVYTVHLYY
jgi:hypothetical protein